MMRFSITDDHSCMAYLNNWDKILANLDVVSDYRTEKKEILAIQGRSFPFSFGDVRLMDSFEFKHRPCDLF